MTTNSIFETVFKPTDLEECVVLSENRKVKSTKKALKDALIELHFEKKLSEISVSELCKLADVNRSTFYSHYTALTEIMDDIEQDFITHLPYPAPQSLSSVTEKVYLDFILYIEKNPKRFIVLFKDQRVVTKLCDDIIAVVEKHTTPEDLIYHKYLIQCFVYGSFSMIEKYLTDNTEYSPKQFAKLLLDLMKIIQTGADTIIKKS